jgi:MBOAT, membrane-bound O-acyltransferase family
MMMAWDRLGVAVVMAFGAALAFYAALRLAHRGRTFAWLGCSAIVGLSPCVIHLTDTPLRFLVSLFAISLLVKLYSAYRQPQIGLDLGFWSYAANLPNGFWLVQGTKPSRPPMNHDLRRLGFRAPLALLSVVLSFFLFHLDWSTCSFVLEHVLKVTAVVTVVVLTTNATAAVYRLVGGEALDFMRNPFLARTPADFWRRWNVPAHQFLNEYVFKPAGGLRKPIRATLITFGMSGLVHEYVFGIAAGRVQGWQLFFFLVQGIAVVATMNLKPQGRLVPFCVAGTWVWNLASSVLFFVSVNQVVPFYSFPGIFRTNFTAR